MLLPHDMVHIATQFSAFCITIWCILQHDLTYIAMRWGTDFKRDASDPQKRCISFCGKIYTFCPKSTHLFTKRIYAFYSEDILFFKKVLWFDGKSTIVLPKKYYRFLKEGLSRCNRLTVS